jgi:hypothetical protein
MAQLLAQSILFFPDHHHHHHHLPLASSSLPRVPPMAPFRGPHSLSTKFKQTHSSPIDQTAAQCRVSGFTVKAGREL